MSGSAGRTRSWASSARSVLGTLVDPPPEVPHASLRQNLTSTPLHTWLFLAGITFAMFSGYSGHLGLPISLDRLFLPAAVCLLLLDGRRPVMRMTAAHWLVVIFVAWTLIDMILRGTFLRSSTQFALLDRTIMPFLVFLLAPLFLDTPFRRRLLLVLFTAIGGYLGVTALLEITLPQLAFPSYITNPDLGLHFGRARGPMMGGDALGVAAVVTGLCAGMLWLRTRGPWRLACACVVGLAVVVVAISLTRAVWVGAVASFVVVTLLVPTIRRRTPHLIAGVVVLAGAVAVALPGVVAIGVERLNQRGPVYDRLGSNDAALNLLHDLPLTGIGWTRFYPHGAEWFRQSDEYPTNAVIIEVHNVVLSRAAELGIPAAILFVTLLAIGPGRSLWNRATGEFAQWRVIAAASFVAWFITAMFGPMSIPFPNLSTFVVCGVAASAYLAVPRDGQWGTDPGAEPGPPGRLARTWRRLTGLRAIPEPAPERSAVSGTPGDQVTASPGGSHARTPADHRPSEHRSAR